MFANVVALLALFFALGGTAWATKHYLIGSTKQIKPSVLSHLRGAVGPTGPTGPSGVTGPAGSTGASGATGAPGTNLTAQTTLPSGQSESGVFAGSGGDTTGDWVPIQMEFTQPLAAPLSTSKIIDTTTSGNGTTCTGPGHAAAGYLCIYNILTVNASGYGTASADNSLPSPDPGEIYFFQVSGAPNYVEGTWTVTAP
jgi:hypothetical protein